MAAQPRWRAGSYYTPPTGKMLSAAAVLNELRAVPIDVPRATRLDRIASEVSVLASGALLRWGVYADDGQSRPGRLLLDTGAIGDGSTTGLKEATISLTLGSRRYWLALVVQGAACSLRSNGQVTQRGIGIDPSALTGTLSNDNGAACFYQSGVSAALPAAFAVAGVRIQAPVISVRAA